MFKFGTISAFKHVRNNPRMKAVTNTTNGAVAIPDEASGLAPAPANADQAKGRNLYVAINLIDKPEINSLAKGFVIKQGEFVNLFQLEDLKGLPVELDASVITTDYGTLVKGDLLVPAGDGTGLWTRADGTAIVAKDYAIRLKIVEKTTYFDAGVYAIVDVR